MRILPALFAIALLAAATTAGAQNAFDANTKFPGGSAWLNSDGNLGLIIGCDEKNGPGSINLGMFSKTPLGKGQNGIRNVVFQFDGTVLVNTIGLYGDTVISLGYPAVPSSDAGKIVQLLRTSKHVVMRAVDFQGVPVTDEFNLDNAGALIDKAIATCGDTNWTSSSK